MATGNFVGGIFNVFFKNIQERESIICTFATEEEAKKYVEKYSTEDIPQEVFNPTNKSKIFGDIK